MNRFAFIFVNFACFFLVQNISAQALVVIDGIKDPYWGTVTAHIHLGPENINYGEVDSDSDCSCDLYLAWDEGYLYGFAEAKDDSIGSKNNVDWWENDAISFNFDLYPQTLVSCTENASCYGYDITSVNITAETGFGAEIDGTENTVLGRSFNNNGYNIEFAIPFNEIINYSTEPPESFIPESGKQAGFLFEIIDQDSKSLRDGNLVWGNYTINGDYWLDAKQLGSLTLLADNQIQLSHDNLVPNRTIYVDSSNTSGIEYGTQEYPFNTIQEGIDVALRQDTVLVYPGRYKENIDFMGRSIVLTSLQMRTGDDSYISSTIIDGDNKGIVVGFYNSLDSTTILNGFSIVNGYDPNYGAIKISGYSTPRLMNLIIRDNISGDIGGGLTSDSGSPTSPLRLTNLKIFNNSAIKGGGLCFCCDCHDVIMDNVLIYNNSAKETGGSICSGQVSNLTLNNVTIANNTSSEAGIITWDDSEITLNNCILWNNLQQEIEGNVNAVYSNIKGGYSGEGNINKDPLFVNAGEGDFRLQDGSPCINSGTPDTSGLNLLSEDLEGYPRIYDARIDMGAHESVIPDVRDTAICYNHVATAIFASGSDIKWYGDELLKNLLHQGDTLTVEVSKPENDTYYTYYATQTLNNKEGIPKKVVLTVSPSPEKPDIILKGDDILICLDSGMYSYNWHYEDQLLTGETKQFCEINANWTGNYYVETGNEYHCRTMSDPFYVTEKYGLLKSSNTDIEIYPVPNKGNFRIYVKGGDSGRIYINIRNFSGTIIKSLITDKNIGILTQEVNLAGIPKGIYIIEIFFNKKTFLKKILIE
jgi:hypothetical protein